MEPRARAGKNVGKMNFTYNESQLLYSHGDVSRPLPETVRVLDEIVTEFIQGVAFEATRAAQHAGRQKVKFEDFEFAMRRNPYYMGKIQEVFEKKREIEAARKLLDEKDLIKEAEKEEKERGKRGRKAKSAVGGAGGAGGTAEEGEEVLGEQDDDVQAEEDVGSTVRKR